MKLLTKNQIQEHKNKERQIDVDQALNFARKVDALRETKDKEEASLSKFRNETAKAIQNEISLALSKRDHIIEEIKSLEEKRNILIEPLDRKWIEVNAKSTQLDTLDNKLKDLSFILESREKHCAEKSKELESLIEIAKLKVESTAREHIEVLRDRREAADILESSKSNVDRILSEISKKAALLDKRELEIAVKESNVDIRLRNLNEREHLLNNRERSVNDRYQTLLRTEKRLNK